MILDDLMVSAEQFEQGTGWALKPEGACRGEVCVPLPSPPGPMVDVRTVADTLGMPVVEDPEASLWAVGPASFAGVALPTAEAPELELPDVGGEPFRLSSLRGQKVFLVAWAPY